MNDFMTAQEVAAVCRCSISRAYKLMREADDSWACAKETIDGKGWSGMKLSDWIGGLLWALPLLAAFEWLTR